MDPTDPLSEQTRPYLPSARSHKTLAAEEVLCCFQSCGLSGHCGLIRIYYKRLSKLFPFLAEACGWSWLHVVVRVGDFKLIFLTTSISLSWTLGNQKKNWTSTRATRGEASAWKQKLPNENWRFIDWFVMWDHAIYVHAEMGGSLQAPSYDDSDWVVVLVIHRQAAKNEQKLFPSKTCSREISAGWSDGGDDEL